MGTAPRREPSRLDPVAASRDLARQLLQLLHHAGLIPSQLAAMDDVPYDVTALNRFLSGEALPPPHLIDIVTRLCGGDREGLQQAYELALRSALTTDRASAPRPPRRPDATSAAGLPDQQNQLARQGNLRSRRVIMRRLATATVGFAAVGAAAIAVATVAVNRSGVEPSVASNRDRAQAGRGGTSAPAPAQGGGPAASSPAPAEPQPGRSPGEGKDTEYVKNGDFAKTPRDWWVSDKVRIKVSSQRLRVTVAPNSGKNHMDAMVMQNLPAVELGKDYVLEFEGSASTKTMITVTLQREMEMDAPRLFTKETMLISKLRRFSFRFTATDDLNPPLICFQVGGHPRGHTMWLDSVSLTEAD